MQNGVRPSNNANTLPFMSQHEHEPSREHNQAHSHERSQMHGHDHNHAPGGDLPDAFDADYLELEARLSAEATETTLGRIEAVLREKPAEIVELGSGSGADAVALAQRFPTARVHALDFSAELLARTEANALAAGVSARVTARFLDLDADWSGEVPLDIDLVWASLSLHHVKDPAKVLRQVYESLRSGGIFVLTEMTGEEGYVPDDLGSGNPGLREGLKQKRGRHEHMAGFDWPRLLTEAGFASVKTHAYDFVAHAENADGARYLEHRLDAERGRLLDDLSDEDCADLEAAIHTLSEGLSQISFTSGRVTWLATRP